MVDTNQLLEKATHELRRMRLEAETLKQQRHAPIAVIGMACRFPAGANDPQSFWNMLQAGRDGIRDTAARWAQSWRTGGVTLPAAARWAGLLDSFDRFDAAFFNISPREASKLDPQHRLLLEVAWEALEAAGYATERLVGTATGFYVGTFSHDYEHCVLAAQEHVDAYAATGLDTSFMAGRVAYTLGLQGPAMAVTTACSSSLVALHLACQSLRRGETEMALAAGVNLILSPLAMQTSAETSAFSPDGRCRTFDARANGAVRGEGCGLLVLKRLADAQRDHDPILAVVRGTAVNQDGRSSSMTAPNPVAQAALVRQALADARLQANQIDYVEAHGTGTPLGDPIEMEALREVLGAPRPDGTLCTVGSVKTNIGHLESAAGMAGLCKVILALQHEQLPPHLNFESLNPMIRLEDTCLQVAAAARPWPRGNRPRFAGVSSFGLSGTNAHAIVGEAEVQPQQPAAAATGPYLLPLSARSPTALRSLAQRYLSHLETAPADAIAAIAYTAGVHRMHHPYRLAVLGENLADWRKALTDAAQGKSSPAVAASTLAPMAGRHGVAFVCAGQGAQWLGMGRELLASSTVFREQVEACDAALRPYTGWSVIAELQASAEASRLSEAGVLQPLNFAMHLGLAAVWRAWGVHPDAVVGHSLGEVAAAHLAGILTLDEAARVISLRGQLMQQSPPGGMLAVDMPRAQIDALLAGSQLEVAVHNGANHYVLAGPVAAVQALQDQLGAQGSYCRRIHISIACHTSALQPLCAPLQAGLASLQPKPPSLPFYSTVTGALLQEGHDAAYWTANMRQPVLFGEALAALREAGHTLFIELSPHAILQALMARDDADPPAIAVASMRRDTSERRTMLLGLGRLYAHGYTVDFAKQHAAPQPRMPLPAYPWERQSYWVDVAHAGATRGSHPLLGPQQSLSTLPGVHLWETFLSPKQLPYLAEHRLGEVTVLAGACLVEMMLAAARQAGTVAEPVVLHGVTLHRMVVLDPSAPTRMQVVLQAAGDSTRVQVSARNGTTWTLHAEAAVRSAALTDAPPPWPQEFKTPAVDGAQLYARMARLGLQHGPLFARLQEGWRTSPTEAFARLRGLEANGHGLHPALLDAAFHTLLLLLEDNDTGAAPWVPVGMASVHTQPNAANAVSCAVRLRPGESPQQRLADVDLYDAQKQPVAALRGVCVQQLAAPEQRDERLVFHRWEALPPLPGPQPAAAPGAWLVVGGDPLSTALRQALTARGATVTQMVGPDAALPQAPLRGVVHLGSLAAPAPADGPEARHAIQALCCDSPVRTLRALFNLHDALPASRQAPRLWLVTAGAHRLPGDGAPLAVQQSLVWGLGRSIAQEHPELRCTRVDVAVGDTTTVLAQAEALASELLADGPEEELVLRNNQRYGGRLTRQPPWLGPAGPVLQLHRDATYLITGGLGGLGLALAQWLAAQGARHLALVGRRGVTTPAQRQALEALQGQDVHAEVMQADVADDSQVQGLLARIASTMPPLRGIVHTAAELADALLAEQTPERFATALGAKAWGAWHLHHHSSALPLDFFVLYSSAAGLLGAAGASNYAAANAFLDGLAALRRSQGRAALSIAWGPFTEVGMAAASAQRGERLAARGMRAMPPSEGTALLSTLLQRQPTQVGVVPLDAAAWLRFYPHLATSLWLGPLLNSTGRAATASLRAQLDQASEAERPPLLEAFLARQVAQVLQVDPSSIARDTPLRSLGVDSLAGLELHKGLQAALGIRLPLTLLWTQPNLAGVSAAALRAMATPNTAAGERP